MNPLNACYVVMWISDEDKEPRVAWFGAEEFEQAEDCAKLRETVVKELCEITHPYTHRQIL